METLKADLAFWLGPLLVVLIVKVGLGALIVAGLVPI